MPTNVPRGAPARDAGSIPLAMMIAFFVITMSVLALSVLAVQVSRDAKEAATAQSAVSLNSGVAEAAQALNGKTLELCGVQTWTPDGFTTAPDGLGAYRWWVDEEDLDNQRVTVVVEANSGSRYGAFTGATALDYRWDSAAGRWVVESRVGQVTPAPAPRNTLTTGQATGSVYDTANTTPVNGGSTLEVSDEQAAEGTTSFKLTNGTSVSGALQLGRVTAPAAAVTPGETYTATYSAYSDNTNRATRLYALFYNDAGTQVGAQYFSTPSPITPGEWATGSGEVVAPADATRMVLRIYPLWSGGYTPPVQGDVLYFDKVSLSEGTTAGWARPPSC